MASKPGVLTDWPWTPLGKFKYVVLAPWAIHGTYSFLVKDEKERDLTHFLILPCLLMRMLHDQLWISLSRHRTAKGNNRIVDKGIEFEQVDRERNWDDHIILNGLIFYIVYFTLPGATHMPIWRADGAVITMLLHMGPVEFLYYWFHRALHHHYLYTRYHSHHHSSIVTEPITAVIHPFAEHIVYSMLFSIPLLTTIFTGTVSVVAFVAYITYIDFMNNMGHCNFELVPKSLFLIFPFIKYLMYSPSFHSLHHTQFRTNYSLFMPLYDYIYGTVDKSSDVLYEKALKRFEESPNAVHLTHLTTPDSIYHMRLGFASLASKPYVSKWYLRIILWPLTTGYVVLTWIFSRTFVLERNYLHKLKLQTWVIPKYRIQYLSRLQNEPINCLIEEAILDAEKIGVKVLSLGLLNQGEELNMSGELYIHKNPELKLKVVDGSSLAIAIILNNIPEGTTQVLFRGNFSKIAYFTALALCQKGIQVATFDEEEYKKINIKLDTKFENKLGMSANYAAHSKIWLVGDGLTKEEQLRAPKGTLFIPFSQSPPKKFRKDCFYQTTPAMMSPPILENMDSCENWLPRRAMSAGRVAGIVHALEGWNVHECGGTIFNIEQIWKASLRHGFRPLTIPS